MNHRHAPARRAHNRCFAITGASGGGKSTLLAALKKRGFAIVDEPGRRIIAEERATGGRALPWVDPIAFARRAISVSLEDLRDHGSSSDEAILFDRGLVDAAAALQHYSREPFELELCNANRYNNLAFMAPPWPEIYVQDEERRHHYSQGLAEYERLSRIYPELGYETIILPKATVEERAYFVANWKRNKPVITARLKEICQSKNKLALSSHSTI